MPSAVGVADRIGAVGNIEAERGVLVNQVPGGIAASFALRLKACRFVQMGNEPNRRRSSGLSASANAITHQVPAARYY